MVGAGTGPEALYVGLTRGRDGNHAHVVTRAADEYQPVGAAHGHPPSRPARRPGRHRLDRHRRRDRHVAAIDAGRGDRARGATSVQTAVERFAAEAEMVYTARTAAALDRLTADGTLTADQRLAFAAEATDTGALARLLRTAELAGHDPDQVLADAVTIATLAGARSLPQVVYRRIERQLAGQLAPDCRRLRRHDPGRRRRRRGRGS